MNRSDKRGHGKTSQSATVQRSGTFDGMPNTPPPEERAVAAVSPRRRPLRSRCRSGLLRRTRRRKCVRPGQNMSPRWKCTKKGTRTWRLRRRRKCTNESARLAMTSIATRCGPRCRTSARPSSIRIAPRRETTIERRGMARRKGRLCAVDFREERMPPGAGVRRRDRRIP